MTGKRRRPEWPYRKSGPQQRQINVLGVPKILEQLRSARTTPFCDWRLSDCIDATNYFVRIGAEHHNVATTILFCTRH